MINAISSQDYFNQDQQINPAAMLQQMVEKLFAKADSGGDGTISADEFSEFLSANPRAERMFSRLVSTTGTQGLTSAPDLSASASAATGPSAAVMRRFSGPPARFSGLEFVPSGKWLKPPNCKPARTGSGSDSSARFIPAEGGPVTRGH